MQKVLTVLFCGIILFGLTGCTNEKKASIADLNKVNDKIIQYFSSDNAKYINMSYNYIDEKKGVIVVGLIKNSEKQQEEFKNNVIDSELIKFVKGSENTDLPKHKQKKLGK